MGKVNLRILHLCNCKMNKIVQLVFVIIVVLWFCTHIYTWKDYEGTDHESMSIPNRLLLDISSNNSSSNLDRIAFLSSQLQRFTMDDIDLKEDEHHLEDLVYKLYKKLYVASARNVHYTLEPQGVCIREDNIKLIIFVHTSPQNVEQRTSIRETWAQRKILHQNNYKIVFVTGFNQNMSMSQLSTEAEQHKDLLLVDFVDSYHNLK